MANLFEVEDCLSLNSAKPSEAVYIEVRVPEVVAEKVDLSEEISRAEAQVQRSVHWSSTNVCGQPMN